MATGNEHSRDRRTFTVDAALIAELGERLVGRPEIALAELIKNAYDADATICEVEVRGDSITVRDNGRGMSSSDFDRFWLRIGTTHKTRRQVSEKFGRPLTGSKGVGRLAVQFLASGMKLRTSTKSGSKTDLNATVNWDRAVRSGLLTQAEVEVVIKDRTEGYSDGARHGCEIVLTSLKHEWTKDEFRSLAEQIWMLQAPFGSDDDAGGDEDNFRVDLITDDPEARKVFQKKNTEVLDTWKAKISGSVTNGRKGKKADISVTFKAGYGNATAETYHTQIRLPEMDEISSAGGGRKKCRWNVDAVEFEIRVYHPKGRQKGNLSVNDVRRYLESYGGVNIYDTGFRLPYYGPDHDWLGLETEHARRLSQSKLLPEHLQEDRMLHDLPTNRRIFGVVEINTSREARVAADAEPEVKPGHILEINPGRDRLVDNRAYQQLKKLVRWSLHYYASRYRKRVLEKRQHERPTQSPEQRGKSVLETLNEYRDQLPEEARKSLESEVREYITSTKAEISYQKSVHHLLGPLATAGMVALAIHHEMGRSLGLLEDIATRLEKPARSKDDPRVDDERIAAEIREWSQQQRTLRGLFSPLADEEDRDVRRRYAAAKTLKSIYSNMAPLMPSIEIDLQDISASAKLPSAPWADWNALFQNVFTNAANATLDSDPKKIKCSHRITSDGEGVLHVSDNGVGLGVPVNESNTLFQPFERRIELSQERRALGMGGQGIGLTIVEMIAENNDCRVRFVEPEPGWSTTFALIWDEK